MSGMQKDSEASPESTAHGKAEEGSGSCEQYLERRNLLLQFLHSDLNLCDLQCHQDRVDLLKKCYFYLEVEPKQVVVRDQNHILHSIDIFQLLDPWQLQKMKKVGESQTAVQLSLLTALLERLQQGREELSSYIETWDVGTFLSRWEMIAQRMSSLSQHKRQLLALQSPGAVYARHRLVLPFEAERRGIALPRLRLSLYTKQPLLFDRKQSFALRNRAKLKWFDAERESYLERYEVGVKLLPSGSRAGTGYGRTQVVTSNPCVVQHLQPGQAYEFTIRREVTRLLVFQKWHDSIVLQTKPRAAADRDSSSSAGEG